jgi:glucan phosphoethanolaminetransferase (alkaline phosphatase superfamily)
MQVHETPLNRIWKHNYLVAVLLLVFADLFIIRDAAWLKDNGTGLRFIVNYLLALIGFLSLLYIIKNLLVYNRALKFFGLLVVGLPLVVQTSYFSVYRKFVTPFGFGFFTENVGLTFKLFIDHINIVKVFLSILFLIGSFYILYKRRSKVKKVLVTVHGILFLGVLAHSVFGWYTVTDFQFSVIGYYNSLADGIFRKTATFKLNKPEVTGIERVPGKVYDNIILIIGEATNLGNMSLYGYSRNTTPSLVALQAEGKLVALKNAVSVGNKTNLSVPYLLTGLEGPDPNGRFYRAPNIFDYAKALGYSTALISAQDFHWGHLDKILIDRNVDLFRDGSSFSPKVDVLKGADDMQVFEKGVLPFI